MRAGECVLCRRPDAQHRGERGAVCAECVERLAEAKGWARPTTEDLARLNWRWRQAAVTGLHLGPAATLEVRGPMDPLALQSAQEHVYLLMTQRQAGKLEVKAKPRQPSAPGWLDTPAGPMLLPIQADGADPVDLHEHLPAFEAWWQLLPAGPERGEAEAVSRLIRGEVPHEANRQPLAILAQALHRVRRAWPGDWLAACDLLQRAERHAQGLVADCARYDRGRLLLALGRPATAARALDGLHLADAPTLLAAITPDLLRLGDCRQGLHHLAAALDEHRAATGAYPARLQDLVPRFLTVLPRCGTRAFGYRPGSRGGFLLQCRSEHPDIRRGWPRWHPSLGVLCDPDEAPDPVPEGLRPGSGPMETLGAVRGQWLSALRERAGDLPGAVKALEGLDEPAPALHRALLQLRRGDRRAALLSLREACRVSKAQEGPLLERRLEAVLPLPFPPPEALPVHSGLFMALLLGGRPELARRTVPDWQGHEAERLAYLCRSARPLPSEDLLGHALERAYDHVTPEAAVYLEGAAFLEQEDASWIHLLLARLYRQAGRWNAAASALAEARRGGAPEPLVELEQAVQDLDRERTPQTLEALLRTCDRWPGNLHLRLEKTVRLLDAGRRVDSLLASTFDPLVRMVRALVEERQGDPAEALEQYRWLQALHPAWPTPRLFEALLLDSLGRREEAAEACARGLAVRPDHVLLLSLKARLGDPAAESRLRELRPDLEDPLSLDLRVIDPPETDFGLAGSP